MDSFGKNQENLIIAGLVGFVLYKLYESYKAKQTAATAAPLMTSNNTLVSPALQNAAPDATLTNQAAYNVRYIAGMGKLATI